MKKNVDVPITVTFRHLDATDALRSHAEKKVAHVIELVPGATDVHVILSAASHHHRQSAEIVVHATHTKLTAHAETADMQVLTRCIRDEETEDMYASIDQAAAKLDRQVRKLKGRVVEGSRRGGTRRSPPPAAAGNE